jgi:hypothetical protein
MEEWYATTNEPLKSRTEELQETMGQEEEEHGWEAEYIASMRGGGSSGSGGGMGGSMGGNGGGRNQRHWQDGGGQEESGAATGWGEGRRDGGGRSGGRRPLGAEELLVLPAMPCSYWDHQLQHLCIDSSSAVEREVVRDHAMPFDEFVRADVEWLQRMGGRMRLLSEESKAPMEVPTAELAELREGEREDDFDHV